jgi:hypothetical protein
MIVLLEYCQSGAAGFLLVHLLHWSMEEVSINTAIEMLDVGEEEGRAMGGGRNDITMSK